MPFSESATPADSLNFLAFPGKLLTSGQVTFLSTVFQP